MVWFLCLIAYQPSWVISWQSPTCRKTVVVIFNPSLGVDKDVHTPPKSINPKKNHASLVQILSYHMVKTDYF